jgi:thiamine pyrophosphate-dependent acetolactate synthase large subunit-like protein
VNFAFQKAMSGKPGPVYLDFPGDVLYAKIPEEEIDWSLSATASTTSSASRSPKRASRSYCPVAA